MNTTHEMNQALEQLKAILTKEQMFFAQAVSVCSVVVEMGLQRASLEDVVDGLNQRFEGIVEKTKIEEVADTAIQFGLGNGLFESVDSETFSLSAQGMFLGRDWLFRIQQEA
jgi:hypothetical protein